LTQREAVEDLLPGELAFVVGVVALGLQGGAGLDRGTKKVQLSQVDLKWQSVSTGSAQHEARWCHC
jgi:hypothetical protein